ncbi:hypothetical protein SAMN04487785_102416 [Dyella jiangningensis]|uniref:hypothetical protein n=1 Tax=Dyella sp. AtDHG13 TaxID=1938897 RepID=UPI00088DCD88|nr:hypothetical protein [Dyella sp. AtDHG13]PXV60688.1 hypothetical protein BDW41_102415 [Dyella sp. AtDHG13]SDJ55174.1 hypothetical protein SAMN04487785_102416 [Dyella jiangningensis]
MVFKKLLCIALMAVVAMTAAGAVVAQTAAPATGMGQAWPNAQDVSQSPSWHVYVFSLNGLKYVQVNDLNGVVRGGVAAAPGVVIPLPLGTGEVQAASAAPTTGTVVYSDANTLVTASPQGLTATPMAASAASGCTSVPDCGKINAQ